MNDQTKEIMLILQEEGAEVIQAVSKCSRFGMDNCNPGKPLTNREHLEEELGDVLAMVDIMLEQGIVNIAKLEEAKLNKKYKLKKWSTIYD